MSAIHSVRMGAEIGEPERGAYYLVGILKVWVEFRVRSGPDALQKPGVRWTLDAWTSYRDDPAVLVEPAGAGDDLWRLEIDDAAAIGWRDGSIGGPNGEQPSDQCWLLWGKDKATVQCMLPGATPPTLECALFATHGDRVEWENDQGRNFKLSLLDHLELLLERRFEQP